MKTWAEKNSIKRIYEHNFKHKGSTRQYFRIKFFIFLERKNKPIIYTYTCIISFFVNISYLLPEATNSAYYEEERTKINICRQVTELGVSLKYYIQQWKNLSHVLFYLQLT
jgi:hypothetical protein